MKKVLIFTAPFGNGHVQAAKEVEMELLKQGHIEVMICDFFSEQYPRTTSVVKFLNDRQYKSRLANQIYRLIYYHSEKLLKTRIGNRYNQLGLSRLSQMIIKNKPDLIINTYPINCTYFLKTQNISIPVYNVITDYYANSNWISKDVRRHFIASEKILNQFKNQGIQNDQIEVTGIPIREAFSQLCTDETITLLKEKYKVKQGAKVILLIARTKCTKLKTMIRRCEKEQLTVFIVCGHNQALYKKIQRRFSHYDNLQIFGFVDQIDEIMHISDIMVTKPGGITITEASQVGLPLILLKPIYGQELENANYFTSKEAAKIAYNYKEAFKHVRDLLKNRDTSNLLKQNIKQITKSSSAKAIVESILSDFVD
jgi:processive 1,2-diacylglycerol beta-glucosyltransferase